MAKDAFQLAADDQSIGSLGAPSLGDGAGYVQPEERPGKSGIPPEIARQDRAVRRYAFLMILLVLGVGIFLSMAAYLWVETDAGDEADDDEDDMAIGHSLVVAACFAALVLVFWRYDSLVRRRHSALLELAQKSKTIVDQLFPSAVRERLLERSDHSNRESDDGPVHMHNSPVKQTTLSQNLTTKELTLRNTRQNQAIRESATPTPASPRKTSTNYLSSPVKGARGLSSSLVRRQRDDSEHVGQQEGGSKVIAELYQHTTVFFADIAGFTAWSSNRQPQAVFTLLESVYNSFDEIALSLRVFKVETIGDSYMAVTGLPEPDDDHAINMARFAYQCILSMNKMTEHLEAVLGPGTRDLSIRCGLHSGPVTGGVLRGQKSRFQLFGDTVNTASRMESTGKPGKIQVSQETADELVGRGKVHWLRPRKDKIVAKGKGELSTYWLEPRKKPNHVNPHSNVMAIQFSHETESPEAPSSSVAGRHTGGSTVRTTNVEHRERLVDYNTDVLLKPLLRAIVARETAKNTKKSVRKIDHFLETFEPLLAYSAVSDSIVFPDFDPSRSTDDDGLSDGIGLREDLRAYISEIASLYNDVSFHGFEHASHVSLAADKLMERMYNQARIEKDDLYEMTYGISGDPLTHFAVVFASLVHDVGHTGIPNAQLIKEESRIALLYDNQSVAEQHSLSLAWKTLLQSKYRKLRSCIYSDNVERKRFRQILVNTVMATDIANREVLQIRTEKWERAFGGISDDDGANKTRMHERATALLETIVQVADVSHTMQHWTIYRRWNEKLFDEMKVAFDSGRASFDPAEHWYRGELAFFDNYVIPLGKRLHESRVYTDQYLKFAQKNRIEWENTGVVVVDEMRARMDRNVMDQDEDDIEDDDSIMEGASNIGGASNLGASTSCFSLGASILGASAPRFSLDASGGIPLAPLLDGSPRLGESFNTWETETGLP